MVHNRRPFLPVLTRSVKIGIAMVKHSLNAFRHACNKNKLQIGLMCSAECKQVKYNEYNVHSLTLQDALNGINPWYE